MKFSMRNLLVISSTTALVASLSMSLSGCKKHSPSEAQNGSSSSQSVGQPVSQNGETSGSQNPAGHTGTWSAKDAQVAAGQPVDTSHPAAENNSGSAVSDSATANSGSVTSGSVATSPGSTTASSGATHDNPAAQGQIANVAAPANGVTPVNGVSISSTGVTSAPAVAEVKKEIPVTCFVETFKHKATPGHDSEEACSHHKNLVSLSHKVINPKSVCVRVNNVPVKFQAVTGGELLIGSIAGPKSTISVSYCTGKNTCEFTSKNDCLVPKDEFLDAIGGSDTDEGAVAQWENTGNNEADSKLNNDVKRELADIDDAAPEHPGQAGVFKDWTNEKTSPSCGQTTAQASTKK